MYKLRSGLGLLDGLLGGNSSSSSTAAPATTPASLVAVVSDAAAGDSTGPLQALLDLLTGVTAVLPVSDLASLLGINTSPIPSPLADPLGFVTHPLITPIILAVMTMNLPALALAQGALAGNLLLTHLLAERNLTV